MSVLLKRVGQAVGVLVGAVAAFVVYAQVDGIPRYEAHPPELHVEVTPERVARGKHLSTLICQSCHADERTGAMTGKHMADVPSAFGVVYSKNITKSRTEGIGAWTDGQLAYLLRTGLRPDGQYLPIWMPKFPNLADEDVASIIAFLRSDDPVVAASETPPPGATQPALLAKVLTHTVMKPLPYPAAAIAMPARTDRAAYGKYLVSSFDCYSCHSSAFETADVMHPEKSAGYMGGGNKLIGADGKEIFTANLTPDDATGIGRWSEDDFVRAVRKGFRPDGRVLHYPMLPMPELQDDEARAIYAYLRTVPKLHNEVPRPAASEGGPHPGKRLYAKYGCGACHGEGGVGMGGLADLRRANEHFKDDAALRAWLDDAPSQKPGTKMPAWKGVIAEEDYGPLMAYVRSLGADERQAER